MRITKLSIKNFKNLKIPSWELNPEYPIAVIVGKNASGKTNLIEAIVKIFQTIILNRKEDRKTASPIFPDFEFEFELSYEFGTDTVTIAYRDRLQILLNNREIPAFELTTFFYKPLKEAKDVLPRNIFVYYAGTSNRLKNLVAESNETFARVLRESAENPTLYYDATQPVYYCEPIYFRFVFWLLMISPVDNVRRNFLALDFGIESLESFNFIITKPDWSKSKTEETLWDAPARLQSFMTLIKSRSLDGITVTNQKANEYQFAFSAAKLTTEIVRELGTDIDVFQLLSSLYLAGYVKNLEIYFRKRGVEKILEFADLSEGEKQRIAIRGAMEIFRGIETLFLLDEPDAFAHPRWQWDFVPDINAALEPAEPHSATTGDHNFSQTIYITHSPLVLSTVKENAFILDNGEIKPLEETFGQDANTSLVRMEAEKQVTKATADFAAYFALIEKGEGESDSAKEMRRQLEETYGLNHPELSKADMWIAFYS